MIGAENLNMKQSEAFSKIRKELLRAQTKPCSYSSAHEGYAVILEGLDKLWDEVKHNRTTLYEVEAVQVAATAIQFLIDVCK